MSLTCVLINIPGDEEERRIGYKELEDWMVDIGELYAGGDHCTIWIRVPGVGVTPVGRVPQTMSLSESREERRLVIKAFNERVHMRGYSYAPRQSVRASYKSRKVFTAENVVPPSVRWAILARIIGVERIAP
jgi:hypothetical protein